MIITDAECAHFIHISKDSLQRATVTSDKKGYISKGRSGSNTWIPHDHDEITKKVGERIAKHSANTPRKCRIVSNNTL